MSRHMRIDQRLLVLIVVAGAPLIWFGYVLASEMIYRGIVPHKGYSTVDLKTLGYFPFDAQHPTTGQIPDRFHQLDGTHVELSGFMFAGQNAGGELRDFELVWNVQQCCFGGPPKVQAPVFARCPQGQAVQFDDNMVNLVGILHVKIEKDHEMGMATAVYELDVERVDRVR